MKARSRIARILSLGGTYSHEYCLPIVQHLSGSCGYISELVSQHEWNRRWVHVGVAL